MRGERISDTPVRTKAVLVEPASLRVLWMNESASAGFPDEPVSSHAGPPIDQIVPAGPNASGADTVRAVACSGVPQHLRADVVTTGKGSLSMVTSIYPMPDGTVLVLTENTWLLDKEPHERPAGPGRTRRR